MYFKIDSKTKLDYGDGLKFFWSLLWRTTVSGLATLIILAAVVGVVLHARHGFSLLTPVYLTIQNGPDAWFLFSVILGLSLTTMMVSTWVAVSWFMRGVIGYSGQLFWPIIQMWVAVVSYSLKLGVLITGSLGLIYLPLVLGGHIGIQELVMSPVVRLTAVLLYLGLAPYLVGSPSKRNAKK